MLVGADALDQIAKPLHQDAASQHIAQGGDVLAVAIRLVERFREPVGHQQGKVGVLAAQRRIGIAVTVDGVDAFHALGHHMTVGVHAEGTHLVAVLLGAVEELGLIDHVGDMLEHLGRQLHTDANIHLIVDELDPQILTLGGEPLCAGSAGGSHQVGAVHIPLVGDEPIAVVQLLDLFHRDVEAVLDLVLLILINVGQDL